MSVRVTRGRRPGTAGTVAYTASGTGAPSRPPAIVTVRSGALERLSSRTPGARFSASGTPVTLDVVDDGRGFDPLYVPAADGGFGLPAMRSRAESLGGTFAVESAPGQGTAVAVTLPLPLDAVRAAR
jgi:signal transduction histidine kinase